MSNRRQLDETIRTHFAKYKQALVLLGARQVGKTTILKKIFPNAQYLLVDNEGTRRVLESYDINSYRQILANNKEIIIDELHLLTDPGRAVKIIYDQLEDVRLIVTGSSALHIKNKSSESMAGRKIEYFLYPLSFSEYLMQSGTESSLNTTILDNMLVGTDEQKVRLFDAKSILENVLLFGLYPQLVNLPRDTNYLAELANSAVFKDILELNLIDNKSKAQELLKLLAYQIGNLISYSEIATRIGLDQRTVQRYIDIFEQSYILYRIYPYSTNKRNEIGRTPKIYFWDLGIRNALIDNFDEISIRSDSGAMFENFIITEVKKIISYTNQNYSVNYWRQTSGSEVDLVLSNHTSIFAAEIKLTDGKVTRAFKEKYPEATTRVINSANFY
jgi:predicted AAA+ superfamily ATPase